MKLGTVCPKLARYVSVTAGTCTKVNEVLHLLTLPACQLPYIYAAPPELQKQHTAAMFNPVFMRGTVLLKHTRLPTRLPHTCGLDKSMPTAGSNIWIHLIRVFLIVCLLPTTHQVSPQFESTTHDWTHKLATMMQSKGPGYFHYVSRGGSPILLGVRIGQLNTEHFTALFLQRYAPGTWLALV